ncbi:UNVERIFIED_CONTAM: putative mitochondrial protein [Sesamum angustifolium]|uniref:Mitochondrial protein n=1 Tax=Sesamum angustifolium TaxID=2727405 RepID=A0AAW2LW09_9LAMI
MYLLCYLKGTPGLGLFFPANTSLQLCAYSDSDWVSCPDSHCSLTGYCVFLGGALISWKQRSMPPISFLRRAEYRSIAEKPIFHERTKHLDINCHLVCEQFKQGFIAPQHISSNNQLTDILTKSLSAPAFTSLFAKRGLHSAATS